MTKERNRLMMAMSKRKLSKVQYENLARTLDILTKNIQLLSDKPTENVKGFLTKEQTEELFKKHSK